MNLFIGATFVVGALAVGSCKGGGAEGPTAPTAATPTGCSGAAINGLALRFGSLGGGTQRFSIQVFGETIAGQAPPFFYVTRSLVPCEYELTAQILETSGPVQVAFGFQEGGRAPQHGGIDPPSIVVLEGPTHRVPPIVGSSVPTGCLHEFGSAQMTLPATLRMRFRVSPTIGENSRC